jgi:AcrR family transcriptional regulator
MSTTLPENRSATRGTPDRQREILQAAVQLFHRNGYHATGMSDIGGALGLTGPALYRHFESKSAILETALLRSAEYMERKVAQVITATTDPLDTLQSLVRDIIDVLVRYPAVVAIAETERRYLSDRARAIYDRSSRLRLAEWVGPLRRIRPELTESDARLVVAASQGLILQAVRPAGLPEERVRSLLFDAAMATLLAPLGHPLPVQ